MLTMEASLTKVPLKLLLASTAASSVKNRGAKAAAIRRKISSALLAKHRAGATQEKAGGSFFWTYRMNWMDGGEWGFKQCVKNGAITAPPNLGLSQQDVQGRIQNAQGQAQQKKQETHGSHCNFWDSQHPGQYEHQRFEQGWDVGFNDAMAFFGAITGGGLRGHGGDKIGMLDLWVRKRIIESGQGGKFVWEFEQGLRQGVRDFYQSAGI